MEAPGLLKTDEVAALLRVHPKHVYRLLKQGLPARRVGAEWRFDREEVVRWSRGASPAGAEGGRAASPAAEAGAAGSTPPLVAANGDLVVRVLLRLVGEAGLLLGLVEADRESGVRLLEARRVLAAGCHAGGFPTHVAAERVARVHLVLREVGLAGRPGHPAPAVADLPGLRLASRPRSAGVRGHLDAALRAAGLDPEAVQGRALALPSHLDVACAVASGRAEAGLLSRAWAARLGLPFAPLAREPYGLLVRAGELGDRRVVRICEVAQSAAFRAEAGRIPGYDAAGAGDIRYDA
jgi:excisionase family DNA binding protein